MAFENVDVARLKKALIECKNSINYKTSEDLINSISNDSVWISSSQKNLKDALSKLSNTRYKNLEDKLNCYITVASYIEEYQNLQKENVFLEKQYDSLSNNLYYTEYYTTSEESSDGTITIVEHSRRVKDTGVELKMKSVRMKINENITEMDNFKSEVSNLI